MFRISWWGYSTHGWYFKDCHHLSWILRSRGTLLACVGIVWISKKGNCSLTRIALAWSRISVHRKCQKEPQIQRHHQFNFFSKVFPSITASTFRMSSSRRALSTKRLIPTSPKNFTSITCVKFRSQATRSSTPNIGVQTVPNLWDHLGWYRWTGWFLSTRRSGIQRIINSLSHQDEQSALGIWVWKGDLAALGSSSRGIFGRIRRWLFTKRLDVTYVKRRALQAVQPSSTLMAFGIHYLCGYYATYVWVYLLDIL